MASVFTDVGARLGSDVIQLVVVLRRIAVNTCVVFSAGLFTSIAAFIALRRLEPPVRLGVVTAASAREDSPGPRHDDTVANIVTSATASSVDGGATDTVIADLANSSDIKMARRMPFSETHV